MFNLFSFCDAAERYQITFQDPATPIAEGMAYFYNYLMTYCIGIGVFVLGMLVLAILPSFLNTKYTVSKFTHSSLLEIIWTILPASCLVVIANPSFSLLFSLDEVINPQLTLKVIGHQWYWSYEYSGDKLEWINKENVKSDTYQIEYDSYMIPENELKKGQLRLLETDNQVRLPRRTHIRLLVTSSDVIHSWAVPSFGIKVDACPGRLSQAGLFIKRTGLFYGQCSEICGVNHGFMPIVVKSIRKDAFSKWLSRANPTII